MLTRRMLVTSLLAAPAVLVKSDTAFSELPFIPLEGTQPGDYGYKHWMYHASYQQLFGALGHCACGDGECRVTDWRTTQLESPKGYDVIYQRSWYALPITAWMPDDPKLIPADLFRERAHICAYVIDRKVVIACALINATQA
jgi:hypothetical protein